MSRQRRHRGEGSVYRKCGARYGCPPAVDGRRPDHERTCAAPFATAIDLGIADGRRKRVVLTAKTARALRAKVAEAREQIDAGVTPNDQLTVEGWLTRWLDQIVPDDPRIRARTAQGYRSYVARHIVPSIGGVRVQALTPEHVRKLHADMRAKNSASDRNRGEPLSPATIRQAHTILQSALGEALRLGIVGRNVATLVRKPSAKSTPHPHLDAEQARAVLRVAPDERTLCRLVVALALGLRQGEALGLRWHDYRLIGGEWCLVIDEAVARIKGEGLIRTDVKSSASHRVLPVPEPMQPIFAAWKAKADPDEEYVFPGRTGGPCEPADDWRMWRDSLARAGVSHVPLHGARGSAASLLAVMGVPVWMIARILGHSQETVTLRHYVGVTPQAASAELGQLVAELLPPPSPS